MKINKVVKVVCFLVCLKKILHNALTNNCSI